MHFKLNSNSKFGTKRGKKRARRSTTYPAPPQYPVEGNICITFDDINRAVYKAKKKLGAFIPDQVYELSSDFPKPIHIAVPAEIMEEATRLLAEWFGLSIHTILYLLPRVDTTRTAARDICPTFLMPVKCELSKYRTLTGMCNNLLYPSWGASRTAMIRYLPPAFADGKLLSFRFPSTLLHSSSSSDNLISGSFDTCINLDSVINEKVVGLIQITGTHRCPEDAFASFDTLLVTGEKRREKVNPICDPVFFLALIKLAVTQSLTFSPSVSAF